MEVQTMDELKELKKILESHRQSNIKTNRFPKEFWPRVIALSQHIPPLKIASFLNIDLNNLHRRIKTTSPGKSAIKKLSKHQFLEIPMETPTPHTKQVVLSLPHNITIRIEL